MEVGANLIKVVIVHLGRDFYDMKSSQYMQFISRVKIKSAYRFLELGTLFFTIGDSNEAKIRVAEYSTILFQQGQPRFVLNLKQQLSNVQNV